jgi:hypothetical protein
MSGGPSAGFGPSTDGMFITWCMIRGLVVEGELYVSDWLGNVDS